MSEIIFNEQNGTCYTKNISVMVAFFTSVTGCSNHPKREVRMGLVQDMWEKDVIQPVMDLSFADLYFPKTTGGGVCGGGDWSSIYRG